MSCVQCGRTSGFMASSDWGLVCGGACYLLVSGGIQRDAEVASKARSEARLLAELVSREKAQVASVLEHFHTQADDMRNYTNLSASEKRLVLAKVMASRERLGHELPALSETSRKLVELSNRNDNDELERDIERQAAADAAAAADMPTWSASQNFERMRRNVAK
jgi:hypothetical protein